LRSPLTVRTAVQTADAQSDDGPQEVPSGSGVAPSTQTDAPVEQEVVPARHEPGFWQATPAAQATHAPPLQT
jgi:hypothetical protein